MARRQLGAAVGVVLLLAARPAAAVDPDASADEAPAAAPVEPPVPPPPPAEPREQEPQGEPGAPPVDLFPEDRLGEIVGWELRPEPAPSTTEGQSEEDLDRWMDERLREEQVGAGAVDGWYYALRHQMRQHFRPDIHAMIRERRASMDFVQGTVEELGRHAERPQQTMDPAGVAPETIFRDPIDDEASPLHAPITWHRVELRVRHGRDGSILDVRVTLSSGIPSMDRAAMIAVREGARSVAAPPDAVRGGRPTFVSDWAFEVGDIATRWNQVGGVEDPVSGEVQGAIAGRGAFRTSVVLLRVTDAGHPTFEERRMERRRARDERARSSRAPGSTVAGGAARDTSR